MERIHVRVGKADSKEAVFPEATGAKDLDFFGFAILEKGTDNGEPSVAVILKDNATGKHYIGQTTANLFHQLNAALLGAEQRFKNEEKN